MKNKVFNLYNSVKICMCSTHKHTPLTSPVTTTQVKTQSRVGWLVFSIKATGKDLVGRPACK